MSFISPKIIISAETVLTRLERITADSQWAHQASGVRASLSKLLNSEDPDQASLEDLLRMGFDILEKAASEIPDSDQKMKP